MPGQVPAQDKRFIVLDTSARWRIADPLRFLQSVGEEVRPRVVWMTSSTPRHAMSSVATC